MRVYTAKTKEGREWFYHARRTFGRLEVAAVYEPLIWKPTLRAARAAAIAAGRFRYNDEPALVQVID